MENQKIKEIIDFYYNSKEYHKIPTVINTCGNLEQLMVRFNCVASGQPDGNHNTNNLFYKYYENIKIESKDIIDTIKTYLQSKTNSMGYSKNLFKDDQALINILRQFGESGLNEWCTYWLQFDQETVDIMIEDIQDQLSVEYSLKELSIFDEPTKLT